MMRQGWQRHPLVREADVELTKQGDLRSPCFWQYGTRFPAPKIQRTACEGYGVGPPKKIFCF